MARRKGQVAAQRKQEILAAATKVFAEKGFHAATTAEIAKQAGVAEGTIFRYFHTKKELMGELANSLVIESLTGVLDEFAGKSEQQILEAVLLNRLDLIRRNLASTKLVLYESQFHPDIREVLLNEGIFKAVKVVKQYFDERVRAGAFKQIDSLVAVSTLIGSVFAYVMFDTFQIGYQYAATDESSQLDKDEYYVKQLVQIFLHGIQADQ